mgnify:CR=1 FL=1
MKPKLLLVGPYQRNLRVGQYASPPYGAYRLASWVKKYADITVIDPIIDSYLLQDIISRETFDFVGYSILQPSIEGSIRTIYNIAKKQPKATHLAGGQGASFNAKLLLEKTPLEVIVKGYGELGLTDILLNGVNESTPGIVTPNFETPQRMLTEEEFKEISSSLDFAMIPFEKYWSKVRNTYDAKVLQKTKTTNLVNTIRLSTTNYCPIGCIHCSSTNFLNNYTETKIKRPKVIRLEPPEIISMIKKAITAHPNVESFYFNDDDFTQDTLRLENFSKLSKDILHSKYKYICLSRVDTIDDKILKYMKEGGFQLIFYGVETFSQKLAESMHKAVKPNYEEQCHNIILKTLQAGIIPQISLILFYPGTELSDLYNTIDSSVELVNKGSLISVSPFVEALNGASILNSHKQYVEYKNIVVDNKEIIIPTIVRPENDEIYRLSRDSIVLRDELLSKRKFVSQPIEALTLFKAIYQLTGKKTNKIDIALNNCAR